MNNVHPTPSSVVILFDPSNKHTTLDEDNYLIFYRFTTFNDALQIIGTRQYGQIDLHVPTHFNFNDMRQHPEVYIHTYFVDDDEISFINDTERDKIRDSIRTCCGTVGEEFIERGIMEFNHQVFDEGINLAEQLHQIDADLMDRLLL